MTQYPFDREYLKEEAAQLNDERVKTDSKQEFELSDEDLKKVAGGFAGPIVPLAGVGWYASKNSFKTRR